METINVGMQFIHRGSKRKDIETIVDIHKTYNLSGELIKTRYVSTHEFGGQTVTSEWPITSIQMGLVVKQGDNHALSNNE